MSEELSALQNFLLTLHAAEEMGEFEEPLTDDSVLCQFSFGGMSTRLTIGMLREAVRES